MNFTFFDLAHPVSLVIIFGVINMASSRLALEPKNISKVSLEQIVFGAVSTIIWIGIGMYARVNDLILVFEGFGVGMALMQMVMKLNMPGEHKFFGRPVPGHGKPETKSQIIIKKIIFQILVAAIILLVGFMIIMIYG